MVDSLATKLLEGLFDVKGYFVTDFSIQCNKVYINIESKEDSRCAKCGKLLQNGYYDKKIRTIYIGIVNTKPVYANLTLRRFNCPECGVLTEKQSLYEGKESHSKPVGSLVTLYTKYMDNVSASKLLSISPSKVYRIDKYELGKQMEHYIKNVPKINYACVDEVSFKHNHTYVTVLCNHEDKKVIWMERDRTFESLDNIYKKFPKQLSSLKAVSMDFWRAFESATNNSFPSAKIIYDRFHLSRILNKHIEDERRKYQKTLSDKKRIYIKKHTRWLLLQRKENQNEKGRERLEELKEKNNYLYEMYLYKEEFLSIFDRSMNSIDAKKYILDWISTINKTQIEGLRHFGRKILKRLDNILNWFDTRISNGLAEGNNNVIKTILKRGYGYKDFEYFRMKVLQKKGYMFKTHTHSF